MVSKLPAYVTHTVLRFRPILNHEDCLEVNRLYYLVWGQGSGFHKKQYPDIIPQRGLLSRYHWLQPEKFRTKTSKQTEK